MGPADPLGSSTPGYKTTEFWITVFVILLLALGDVMEMLPDNIAAPLGVFSAVAYKVLRLALKIRQGTLRLEALALQLPKGDK